MRVSEICTTDTVCLPAASTVREAAETMRRRHVGSVVVVDAGAGSKPIGIVTDRDIVVSVVAPGVVSDVVTVGDVMSRPLRTIDGDEDLLGAIRYMREKGVRRLVVTRSSGELLGILAADDAYRALVTQMHDLGRAIEHEQLREAVLRE